MSRPERRAATQAQLSFGNASWKIGDLVIARFLGGDEFNGKITKVRMSGKFGVLFDDGDKDDNVLERDIRERDPVDDVSDVIAPESAVEMEGNLQSNYSTFASF